MSGWESLSAEGTVKFWPEPQGLGAVSVPEFAHEGDVWVHHSVLGHGGLRNLVPGQRVRVTFHRQRQDSFGLVAHAVKAIEDASGP